jgi:hypothetical protein
VAIETKAQKIVQGNFWPAIELIEQSSEMTKFKETTLRGMRGLYGRYDELGDCFMKMREDIDKLKERLYSQEG